jgi:hypothetical protein
LILVKDTTRNPGHCPAMQNAALRQPRDNPPAEELLQNARRSFILAGRALAKADIERYAAIGRDYLELAHAAARIDEQRPAKRFWDLP